MRKNRVVCFVILTGVISMMTVSCSKKLTKVTVPQPTTESAALPHQTAPQRESFETVDPDKVLRETLQTIYFDFNRAEIRPEGLATLQNIGKMLRERSTISILMEGHCDERGSAKYNMGLGVLRADAVKHWLVTYGIADNRLEATSYGKERPAVPNCQDDGCHAKNRRVEFKVLAK